MKQIAPIQKIWKAVQDKEKDLHSFHNRLKKIKKLIIQHIMKHSLHQLLELPSLVFLGPSIFIHDPRSESTVSAIIELGESQSYADRGITGYRLLCS